MKCSWLLFFLVFFASLFAAYSRDFEYMSPVPGSRLNSLSSNVIIRPGSEIDPASLAKLKISVTGEKSGTHDGRLVLSDDGETIVFNPFSPYLPGETVYVKIGEGLKTGRGNSIHPLEYSFTVTPLSKPVGYYETYGKDEMLSDTVPADLPVITINKSDNPAPGYIFLSNPKKIDTFGNYIMMVDNDGKPYKYKKTRVRGYDFQMQPNGLYSYAETIKSQWFWADVIMFVLDSNLNIIDSVQCGNGYSADMHEFHMLPNGHYILLAQDMQPFDLSSYYPGGNPNAMVAGSIIQELDASKNVVFQWRSWDHLDIRDTYDSLVNPVHFNAVDYDEEGNLILSIRHMCQILKIDRHTGNIIWRMGGKKNEFTFVNEHEPIRNTWFSHQHGVKRLPNGNIMLFDNGWIRDPQWSRGVEYQVDEKTKTATLVWEFKHSPETYTDLMGSVQKLKDGSRLICWGGPNTIVQPGVTEIKPDGVTTALEMTLPKAVASYRAYKYELPPSVPVAVDKNELLEGNEYKFARNGKETGVSMLFRKLSGFMYNSMAVEKYSCSSLTPLFSGTAPIVPALRFVFTSSEIDTFLARVKIDMTTLPDLRFPERYSVYAREKEGSGVFTKLETSYDTANHQLVFNTDKTGEFILGIPENAVTPQAPILVSPLDKERVNQNKPVNLKWATEGQVFESQVEVATDTDFISLVSSNNTRQNTIAFSTQPGQKYYWRVRALNINPDSTYGPWSEVREFTATTNFIEVASPNGGESWHRENVNYIIRWNKNISGKVKIELLKEGSFFALIKDSVSSVNGAYVWLIPASVPFGSDYSVRVTALDGSNVSDASDAYFTVTEPTGIKSDNSEAAGSDMLYQNYPNPVLNNTQIDFYHSDNGRVNITLYDVKGNTIAVLLNQDAARGEYSINYNASALESGDYFYRLETGRTIIVRKMTVAK